MKRLKSLLILALGLGLAYWFVQRLDWQVVGAHLREARRWPLALAFGLVIFTMLARALRWQALLAPIAKVGLRNTFAATSLGFGALFVAGRVGEVVRPVALSMYERLRPSATLATILIERVYDMSAVAVLFSVNLLLFGEGLLAGVPGGAETFQVLRSAALLLLAGVSAGIATLALLRWQAAPLIAWLERVSARLPQALMRPLLNLLHHLAEGLSVLVNARELLVTIFHTALVWSAIVAAAKLVFYAFHLELSLPHAIFAMGFGLVGSLVPTPGGSAGAFHAATAKGLETLGVDTNNAAAVALTYHLVAFGSPFLAALYFLVRDEISIGQLREMIAQEMSAEPVQQQKAEMANHK